ncbi:unnamed protein product [Linum trigynum]|uniref:CCHC-type domain-containing protein n=1 Tax=Linum trigynum TaxID=586398 RepID=A0AAV2CM53_9ROSI
MVVWVQFPALSVHFYHKEVLFSLGNMIGRAIKLDYHTQHQQRAKFARLAIELDLSRPLVTRIRLDDQWQYIEYENLPTVCFECGRVGHTSPPCPSLNQKPAEVQSATNLEEKEGFGPWMQVTRRSRRGNRNSDKGSSRQNQGEQVTNGKNGKGRSNPKDMEITTGSKGPAKESSSQREDLDKQTVSEKVRNTAARKSRGKEKEGSEVVEMNTGGKGVLGPIPHTKPVAKNGPTGEEKQVRRKKEAEPGRKGAAPSVSDPLIETNKDKPSTSRPPKVLVGLGPNGTSILIVKVHQYDMTKAQETVSDTPSTATRTKNQQLRKKKKSTSPQKSQVPVAAKALQIWSPIKEKKNKTRTRLASLTLQEIAAWTGAAKSSSTASADTQEAAIKASGGSIDPAGPAKTEPSTREMHSETSQGESMVAEAPAMP